MGQDRLEPFEDPGLEERNLGDRALTVEVEEEDGQTKTHHINVDNVSHLKVVRGALTRDGVIVILGVATFIGFVLSNWGTGFGIFGFVASAIIVYVLLNVEDTVEIGTTADNYRLAISEEPTDSVVSGFEKLLHDLRHLSKQDTGAIVAVAAFVGIAIGIVDITLGILAAVVVGPGLYYLVPESVEETESPSVVTPTASENPVEEAFLQRSHELVSIDNEYEDVLRRYNYRYHFVPDNVVSISEAEEIPFWMKVLVGVILVSVIGLLYSLVSVELVNVLRFGAVAGIAVILFGLLSIPVRVRVVTHGDVSKVFEMSSDDAAQLVEDFRRRGVDASVGEPTAVADEERV